jgi:hypothetical protein
MRLVQYGGAGSNTDIGSPWSDRQVVRKLSSYIRRTTHDRLDTTVVSRRDLRPPGGSDAGVPLAVDSPYRCVRSSTACQNPSLTYMVLTARAAEFAVSELNRRSL